MASRRTINYRETYDANGITGKVSGVSSDDKHKAVKLTATDATFELVGDGDEIYGSIIQVEPDPAGTGDGYVTVSRTGIRKFLTTSAVSISSNDRLVGAGSGYVKAGDAGELSSVSYAPLVLRFDDSNDEVYADLDKS